MVVGTARDRLTVQQRAAVERREASVVLSSGAGCGKTTVLTERYLSHLEDDGAEVSQVVAITFTDRAAREMRGRIRRAVLARLDRADDDGEVRRWEEHLRGLETAQISTIHAFCGNLLRQNAVEAGLDPHFDVLEDYLAANLQDEALADCLQGLLTADTPAALDLRALILLYGWRPVVEAVRRLMTEEDASARQRWLAGTPDEIAAEWRRYARAELLPRYVGYLAAAKPGIARCLWLLRNTPCVGPKMRANVALLLERTPRLAEAGDLAAAVAELTEAAKVGTERAKAWPDEASYVQIKGAFEAFRKELPSCLGIFLEDVDAEAVRVGQRFARVADEAVAAYRQRKRRNAVVDFQDLLVAARDLLRDHADIRERLQKRIRFLLIDELQDTDPVQMELVEHLTGAGMTGGRLFAVGDHAQSIYRFRRADVRLFQELKRRVPEEGRLGLTRNFRSQPAILDFVNALLGSGADAPARNALEDYQPLEPQYAQLNAGPCVEFLWAPREAKENVTEARIREAEWIARRVAAMVGGGEQLVAERIEGRERLRPVRLGDVVLLFRSMSNVALYEDALRRHGLDYYLVGGRAFFAQQEIYDLLNLLRTLENPQDAVSLAGTLRSPFCCLSDEALLVLSRHGEGLWAGLHDDATCERLPRDQKTRTARARRSLARWRSLKDRLPIARLLGEIFADSGYDAATQFEFLGDRKLANLWKLQDMARAFDRSGLFGLAEFIRRLGELVQAQPREEQAATQPESADVVRLMTIHQAKGLEFPVVIIPDMTAQGGGDRNPTAVWCPRLGCVARPPGDEEPPPFGEFGWRVWEAGEAVENWREDLRTLYVACTRPQDYLILSGSLPEDFSPQSTWMLTLAERFDLRTGRCHDATIPLERRPSVRVADGPPGEGVAVVARSCAVVARSPDRATGADRRSPEAIGDLRSSEWHGQETVPQQRLPRPSLMTAGELDRLLDPAAPAVVAGGGDAEDGSDVSSWELPRERVERYADAALALRDRLLRHVLGLWDFSDPQKRELLLDDAIAAQSDPAAAQPLRGELGDALRQFAKSPLFRQLSRADECRRDVEYLVPLPQAGAVTARGVLDCLWRDGSGRHVLLYDTTPKARRRKKPAIPASVALAALAVRGQLGDWPASVRLYRMASGRCESWEPVRLVETPEWSAMWAALAPATA